MLTVQFSKKFDEVDLGRAIALAPSDQQKLVFLTMARRVNEYNWAFQCGQIALEFKDCGTEDLFLVKNMLGTLLEHLDGV